MADSGAISSGFEIGAIDGVPTPLQIAFRHPFALIGFVVSLVAAVGAVYYLTVTSSAAGAIVGVVVLVVGFAGALAIPPVTMSIIPGRRYTDRLEEEYPGSRAYPGDVEDPADFRELLNPQFPVLANARDRGTDFFVFDPDRLIFYSRYRSELLPFLVIPRERVLHAETTSIDRGRGSSAPGIILTISKDDGGRMPVTLAFAGAAGPSQLARMRDGSYWAVDWVDGAPA